MSPKATRAVEEAARSLIRVRGKLCPIDPARLTDPTVSVDSLGRRYVGLPPAARLKSRIPNWGEKDACWVWTGNTNPKGYGGMTVHGSRVLVHRVSYALNFGVDPGSLRVLHTCDNPPCCNPAHLFLGTLKDNTEDMMRKGRGVFPVNEGNGRTTIPTYRVEEIRSRAADGESYSSIARDVGVHVVTVSRIARRLRRVS